MAAKRWFLVAALALAGCSSHAATGPAWPKQHEAEKDGGESLAPHAAARSVAAVEKSGGDEDQPAAKPAATPTAPAAGSAAPAGTAPTMIQEETPVTTEDIIIEIDD